MEAAEPVEVDEFGWAWITPPETCVCDICFPHHLCDYPIYIWQSEHIFHCVGCKIKDYDVPTN